MLPMNNRVLRALVFSDTHPINGAPINQPAKTMEQASAALCGVIWYARSRKDMPHNSPNAESDKYKIPLLDQYKSISPFYENKPKKYSEIMLDGLHVNPIGNAIMGIIVSRLFSLPDPFFMDKSFWKKVKKFLFLMEKYHDLTTKIPYPENKEVE